MIQDSTWHCLLKLIVFVTLQADSNVYKAVLCLLGELGHSELLVVKNRVEQLLDQDQK